MNKRVPLILLWRMILPFKISNPRQCWNAKITISQNHARYRKDYQHESSIKYKDKTWCQDLYKMHQIHYIWGREEKITITKLQYIYPTTNNMLWIGPYDKKTSKSWHRLDRSSGLCRSSKIHFSSLRVSDITGAKHLAHTVNNWPIYDGSTKTFLDLNKWRQQGIKVLEGPEGEYA